MDTLGHHALQIALVSPEAFSAEVQCQAAVNFWKLLLGLVLPAVLLAGTHEPPPVRPPSRGAGARRSKAQVCSRIVDRANDLIDDFLCLLRPAPPDGPPEPLWMSAVLAVPWLLRWQIVLNLLWVGCLATHRKL